MTFDPRSIHFDFEYAGSVDPAALGEDARRGRETLEGRTGPGNDFLGWLDLPEVAAAQLDAIRAAAEKIRSTGEPLVVVGIGGSYLGARALESALGDPFRPSGTELLYAGHQMDAAYHQALLNRLGSSPFYINVISKSGTTTEPGLAFRFLLERLRANVGADGVASRVFATTDASKGALKGLADAAGFTSFVIPDDVGGRFSVLTPVGLLPLAAAGVDVGGLVAGARAMADLLRAPENDSVANNPALAYAAYRNAAYRGGRKIEIMAGYMSALHYFFEWWKQLYGESEGKDGKGIFPAAVDLSTDLHSMGQWMQDGERTIFETVVDVEGAAALAIPTDEDNRDGLNYLAGRSLHDVNRTALKATLEAHAGGDVPCARLVVPELSPEVMGALLYMFEYACGVSAYMLGVNPFDQPGVEAYKKNMFRLLGKPGH